VTALDPALSRWFGVLALGVALAVAWLLSRFVLSDAPRGHNAALDGLRGYLAFGVFLHHATLWHDYAGSGRWALAAGVPYADFGRLCVNLFFMITSLLFVGKLLDSRGHAVDWLTLYIGRVMRIAPLYYVVVAAVLCVVAVFSDGKLREPVPDLMRHVGSWLGFTLFLLPDVNAVPTGVIVARVTWTLAYEWMFYLTLPLIALCLRLRPPLLLVLGTTAFVVWAAMNKPDLQLPTAFIKGAIAAWLIRQPSVASLLRSRPAAVVTLLAGAAAMAGLDLHRVGPYLLWLGFCAVAAGNSVFGLLSNRAAVALGDASYGVYLIHGLLLTLSFDFVIGRQREANLGTGLHWAVVCVIGAAVVLVATASYHLLERPAIRSTRPIAAWLRARRPFAPRRPQVGT
jgi:peptidoglycan/LPS O-acetylase OafA/YrhL